MSGPSSTKRPRLADSNDSDDSQVGGSDINTLNIAQLAPEAAGVIVETPRELQRDLPHEGPTTISARSLTATSNEQLLRQLDHKERKCNNARKDHDKTKGELKETQDKLRLATETIKTWKDNATDHEAALDRLRLQLDSLFATNASPRKSHDSLEQDYQAAQQRWSFYDEKSNSLYTRAQELAASAEEHHKSQTQFFQAQLTETRDELQQLRGSSTPTAVAELTSQQLNEKITALRKENSKLEIDFQDAKSEKNALQISLNDTIKVKHELEIKNLEAKYNIAASKKEFAALQDTLAGDRKLAETTVNGWEEMVKAERIVHDGDIKKRDDEIARLTSIVKQYRDVQYANVQRRLAGNE